MLKLRQAILLAVVLSFAFSIPVFAQDDVVIGGGSSTVLGCQRQDLSGGGFVCGGTCPTNKECSYVPEYSSDGEVIGAACSCVDIPIARRPCGFYQTNTGLACGGTCPYGQVCGTDFGGECNCVEKEETTGGTGTV